MPFLAVRRFALAVVLGAILAADASCSSSESSSARTTLVVAPEQEAIFRAFAEPFGTEVDVRVASAPTDEARRIGAKAIAVVADLADEGSYRLEANGDAFTVHGDAPTGVQYGVAALLEARGYRFFHPYRMHAPSTLANVDAALLGTTHVPEESVRGIHLHTIHPIEGYFAFYEPSEANLARAKLVIDWLVKNRGNYLQYPVMHDLIDDGARHDAWQAHTKAIIDYAHLRGVRVGVGIQLSPLSNLQQAFDLFGTSTVDDAALAARLALLDGVGLDAIQISFGEFSGAQPDAFIAALDAAVAGIRAQFPGAEVSAVVHLGNYPSTQVDYMGMTQLYYYLVRYAADPDLSVWVHTVMYYDLFEDAGNAYGYDSFDGHRDLLFERLSMGRPVAYFPESAYWIAFDNSIPMYLPLYVRSRYTDFRGIRDHATANAHPDLDQHVTFSSGWEWGYWQGDVASLRMGYELPGSWESMFDDFYAPYGDAGATLASIVKGATMDLHTGLLVDRLAPYLASRDVTFDGGDALGVFSQPPRVKYATIGSMDATARTTFTADVLDPLAAMRDALGARRSAAEAVAIGDDVFLQEIVDGLAVDHERARFAHAILSALLAHAAGDDAGAESALTDATTYQANAATIVSRRHARTLDPSPADILSDSYQTAGLYDYGYLREAVRGCFFEREIVEARNVVHGASDPLPLCAIF